MGETRIHRGLSPDLNGGGLITHFGSGDVGPELD